MQETDDILGTVTGGTGGDFIEFTKPDGVYGVELVDLTTETGPNPFRNNEPQTRLLWHFVPEGHDGKPGTFRVYTSFSRHEKSHLPGVCLALGVPVPDEGAPILRSSFVGRTCQAFIVQEPGKKDPSRKFPRIKQLFPKSVPMDVRF